MLRRLVVTFVAVLALAAGAATPSVALGYAHPNVVSANPVNITPHVRNGSVLAIATVGNRVYVGGTFTGVTNAGTTAQITRNYLFAFDRTSGRVLTDFVPAVNGPVETIAAAPNGTSIIIGGRFTTVGGTVQRSVAMLTPTGARVPTFTAKTNGYATKLVVRGTRLIVGGRFSTANAVTRSNLAAFNATTGALDTAFNISVTEGRTTRTGATGASVVELDANAAGSRLVVLGNFRQVGGQPRMQVAMIDLTTNRVSTWSTNRFPNGPAGSATAYQCYPVFETAMRDVEFSPDGSYFVLVTTGGAPDRNAVSLCDTATRWETTTTAGARETWRNCTGGDTLYSVAITASSAGGAVYVGGHQRWLDNCGGRDAPVAGSFAADGIGAINATTGRAIRTWNPGRTRGVGAEELVANADGLHIGSDTESLGGEYHARLGLFPLG